MQAWCSFILQSRPASMISNIVITSHSNTYFKSKKAETTKIGDNATVPTVRGVPSFQK